MNTEEFRDVDGLWMHSFFPEVLIRSAMTYRPRPDDVFIVTYPKCGTTWTQYLVLSILSKGHPPTKAVDFMLASPYLEMMGSEAAETMVRPGVLKTHLPFTKQPYSKQAKYIYVARNPYDVCVSYYYHMRSMTPKSVTDVSFGKFHEMFIAGKVSYGDYFDHLLSWYEHRQEQNVLFFTYEQMKADTNFWTVQIASFLDETYGKELRNNPTLLRRVVDATSFSNMKDVFNDEVQTLVKDMLDLPDDKLIKSMVVYRQKVTSTEEMHEDDGYIRKGIVGDWKGHFTAEQIERTKMWIAEKTKGSDVMYLWKDLDLP
ncbi:sulfotransferase 1B1-like [Amblyomma americanum]